MRRDRLVDSIEKIAQARSMPSDAAGQAALGEGASRVAQQPIDPMSETVVELKFVVRNTSHDEYSMLAAHQPWRVIETTLASTEASLLDFDTLSFSSRFVVAFDDDH